jgi:hypothetical protein
LFIFLLRHELSVAVLNQWALEAAFSDPRKSTKGCLLPSLSIALDLTFQTTLQYPFPDQQQGQNKLNSMAVFIIANPKRALNGKQATAFA